MNTTFKPSVLNLALASALALGGIGSALAGAIGGSVPLTQSVTFVEVATSTPITVNTGYTDRMVASGLVNSNSAEGWKVTFTSANNGKLKRTGSSGGAGSEILYTNIHFVKTGGTLGSGLTAPDNTTKDITTGTAVVDTGGAAVLATTATADYAYDLKITFSADPSLLAGTYTDTVTATIAEDN